MHQQRKVGLGRAWGGVGTPGVRPHPRLLAWPPHLVCGLLARLGPLMCWCSTPLWSMNGLLHMSCLDTPSWMRILVNFHTCACKICIYQDSWKMWVVNPNSKFWQSYLFYFVSMLVVEMWIKDHQQAPPHLVLCSSSSKVLMTKRVHLLDLKIYI